MRFSGQPDVDDATQDNNHGSVFDRVLCNAARQGDAHGDEKRAISVLDAGLSRRPDTTPVERLPVMAYMAELLVRTGDADRARTVINQVRQFDLSTDDQAQVAQEVATIEELANDL